jgi:large subunit ribosomal protein L14e
MEIGRVYTKTTGKEAGKKCVVIDIVDDVFVMVDGNVKRRKCNILHLEPTNDVLTIEKGASTTEVKHVMEKAGLLEARYVSKIKKKERKGGERPKKGQKPKEEASKKGEKKKASIKKKTEEEMVEESLAKV